MDAHWRALDASSTRAEQRAPESLDPKTGTLGLAPSLFSMASPQPAERQSRCVFGDPPRIFIYIYIYIYICGRSPKDARDKKVSLF